MIDLSDHRFDHCRPCVTALITTEILRLLQGIGGILLPHSPILPVETKWAPQVLWNFFRFRWIVFTLIHPCPLGNLFRITRGILILLLLQFTPLFSIHLTNSFHPVAYARELLTDCFWY